MITEALPVIAARGEGDKLYAFGEEVIVHLGGAQTGGRTTLWAEITPPGGGPPPHYHVNEDELFLVQEGKMGFFYDDQWHEAGPGGVVFMPRKAVHTFKNIGDSPSRMLIQTYPAGFEAFFARCAQEFEKQDGHMQRIIAIGADRGIHFLTP